MRNRNKGFTLVEIIISITIGSVVLALMGTMILTSSNFMSNTTNSDMDKRCVDSCMEFIRDQIEYSTDVRIIENKGLDNYPVEGEDNWHCFYIKNHILYRDDSPVFDDSFYNHKQLEILVKDDYKNNMRVDFTYHLNDSDGEKAYGNRDTVVFLNISEKNKPDGGLYVSSDVSLDANKSFSEKGNYAVYYKKSLTTNNSSNTPSVGESGTITGTVADQIEEIRVNNTRYCYSGLTYISYGDYVYYDGFWWKWIDPNSYQWTSGTHPGDNQKFQFRWKKISSDWDSHSGYEYGDIVFYNGNYYKYVDQSHNLYNNTVVFIPGERNSWDINVWEKIENHISTEKNLQNSPTFNEFKRNQTVIKKLNGLNLDTIPIYDSTKNYNIGAIVKEEIGETGVYQYYLKLYDNLGKPGKKVKNNISGLEEVGWQTLSIDYDLNSAYETNDIVMSTINGGMNFFKATDKCGIINYNNYGGLKPKDETNKGKICIAIPLENSYQNQNNLYYYWWDYYQ